jgi:hypothetical protein
MKDLGYILKAVPTGLAMRVTQIEEAGDSQVFI